MPQDTTNPGLFDVLLPLLATGVTAAYPRYGGPAAAVGLSAWDLANRIKQRNIDQARVGRYEDMLQTQRDEQANAGVDLQRSIFGAAGQQTEDVPDVSAPGVARGGKPNPPRVVPLPDLPTGQRYSDLTGVPNANAATSADVPQPALDRETASIAAAAVRQGEPGKAIDMVNAAMRKPGMSYEEALGLTKPPPGAHVQVPLRGGGTYSAETPAPPPVTQRAPTTLEEFAKNPKLVQQYLDAQAKAKAAYGNDFTAIPSPIQETQMGDDGKPVTGADGQPVYTGNIIFPTVNKSTGKAGQPIIIKGGVKARAGGAAPPKADKGGALAAMLGGGGKIPDGFAVGDPVGDAPKKYADGQQAAGPNGEKMIVMGGKWRPLIPKK